MHCEAAAQWFRYRNPTCSKRIVACPFDVTCSDAVAAAAATIAAQGPLFGLVHCGMYNRMLVFTGPLDCTRSLKSVAFLLPILFL
jgi:hypothetical protein